MYAELTFILAKIVMNDTVICIVHFLYIALLFIFLFSAFMVIAPARAKSILSAFPTMRHRAVILCAVTMAWFCASKYGPEPEREKIRTWMLWALDSGVIKDPTGNIATAAEAETVRSFAQYYDATAAEIMSNMTAQLAYLTSITGSITALPVAYIASDIPRSMPNTVTNHNLAATIEATDPDNSMATQNIRVWFSDELLSAPVNAFYASYPSETIRLKVITNSYPDTVLIGGVPCVTYTVEIPERYRGVPLRPVYSMGFGGPGTNEFLSISRLGASVTVAGTEHYPRSGVVTIMLGGEPLTITVDGGITVEASWRGTNYINDGEVKP